MNNMYQVLCCFSIKFKSLGAQTDSSHSLDFLAKRTLNSSWIPDYISQPPFKMSGCEKKTLVHIN